MGLYDRDYWKDKYNQSTQYKEKTPYRLSKNSNNKKTTIKKYNSWLGYFWLPFLIMFLIISFKAYKNLDKSKVQKSKKQQHPTIIYQPEYIPPSKPALVVTKPVSSFSPPLESKKNDSKEKAWAAYYKQSDYCATVRDADCVNQYIRAKREFEKNWP